jgi:hypothetical protein
VLPCNPLFDTCRLIDRNRALCVVMVIACVMMRVISLATGNAFARAASRLIAPPYLYVDNVRFKLMF